MNKRIVSIIQELTNLDKVMTISLLAENFEVSQRTIRNDLNTINDLLIENDLSEISLRSGGIVYREKDFPKVLTYINDGDFYSYKLSKEERVKIASALLINSSGYITLSTIADNLFVSRATVINDLDDIKLFIKENHLEVLSHPNKGLRVEGKESHKRLFLMKLFESGYFNPENEIVSQHISVQAGNKITIQKIVSEQENIHESFLTDDSFSKTLTYLGIMINRNMMGEYIEVREEIDNNKYYMAQDILRFVSQYCETHTTKDEIQFLSELLSVSHYMKRSDSEKSSIKIQLITRQFIESISNDLCINLNGDYDFFENLSHHLESVLTPVPQNYPDSQLIDEVLEENEEVLEVVTNNLNIISQYIEREITKIEIGYIAIHICAALERKKNKEVAFHVVVACHAGIGTSQLLMEKLKKHFNFHIVDIISSHEAENVSIEKADFIISTVQLRNCKVDYVVVSPLLSDEDYIRVGNKIDTLRDSRHLPSRIGNNELSARGLLDKINPIIQTVVPDVAPELMKEIRKVVRGYFNQSVAAEAEIFSPCLHHLLSVDHIQLDVECSDWKDAIRKSAMKLLESGYIEERYIDAMIENVEENGPYIVLSKGFAVPHEGLEKGSVKVGMNLIRLKNPVPFGAEELDPVEFVCCLSAVDHKTHLKAFFNLVNMLQNKEFKEKLKECKTSREVEYIIEKYEYSL